MKKQQNKVILEKSEKEIEEEERAEWEIKQSHINKSIFLAEVDYKVNNGAANLKYIFIEIDFHGFGS